MFLRRALPVDAVVLSGQIGVTNVTSQDNCLCGEGSSTDRQRRWELRLE